MVILMVVSLVGNSGTPAIDMVDVFVKIAEEARRHRGLLLDMGDESAKLKFAATVGAKGGPVGGQQI
eukprot:Skav204470  [mRNA]  locus=scaffold5533:92951:93414:- [translate_table: standard]